MKFNLKKIYVPIMVAAMLINITASARLYSEIETMENIVDLGLKGGSACLMDYSTGEVLYENNSHERLEPASVTKVMTLLLIMEALENDAITLETKITGSLKASQMGGSQIWLEFGEELTVDEMLKAIVVVSANDCAVAMAEHLAGSEEAFVALMNKKAQELGMVDTCFKNSTGLPEEGHFTSAYDIALMTRELYNYDTIFNYTTIWMDSLRNGEMGLSNTNKLIRFYKGATGMKTGFTDSALYCLSATASRDNLSLIATVMKCKTSDERFEDARKLLDYGFSNFTTYTSNVKELNNLPIAGGKLESIKIGYEPCSFLLTKNKTTNVEEEIVLPEKIQAPVAEGDKVGEVIYTINGEKVGAADIIAKEGCEKTNYFDLLGKIFRNLILKK